MMVGVVMLVVIAVLAVLVVAVVTALVARGRNARRTVCLRCAGTGSGGPTGAACPNCGGRGAF